MKRKLTSLLVVILMITLVVSSYSCSSMNKYFIRSPYNTNDDTTEKIEAFDTLEEAKTRVEGIKQLGYVVYDGRGKVAYHPFETLGQSRILYKAKSVADYIESNGYTYGNATVNPAYDRGKTEKLVSCDRFVEWAIFDAGYVKDNNEDSVLALYPHGDKINIETYLIRNGFTKIEDISQVQGGDVIFVGDSQEHAPNLPRELWDYPDHVFICAGSSGSSTFYRYDAGSTRRIQSIQPSNEPLEYPGKEFRFAYRAPAELP